ncbi:MAG TPA: LPS export ABC transporter permease LptG [Steroidobacteraceae bacterium]|nr:LPS export ABC transporter permease LptG [Steroidobacteraceae bacterium]
MARALASWRREILMGVLGRYIVRTVLAYTGLVMLVLVALGALFLFIGQQDDIGVGNYSATQALMFVGLNLPSYLFELLPVAGLIGALLGLGNLARGSELVVMRAAGVTTWRFCAWLGVAGLLLALLMFVVGEYVAPPLGQYARQMKVFAKFDDFSLAGARGTWVRDGDTIISVDQQSASTRFGGIKVFQLGADRRLVSVARAESARVARDKVWKLDTYVETAFAPDGLGATVMRNAEREVRTSLSPEFLGLAIAEPESMGLRDLRSYIRHLQRNDLQSAKFETALWSRLARLAAVVVVVILALPFSIGSLRGSGQGARMVIGVLIGAGFVLLSKTLESSGELFSLQPWLVGWIPTMLLTVLTATLLWRNR